MLYSTSVLATTDSPNQRHHMGQQLLKHSLLFAALFSIQSAAPLWAQTAVQLDKIVVSSSQREQQAIDSLDNVSGLDQHDINLLNASSPATLLNQIPGVNAANTGDDPGTVVNIRGLQEYGRVVVTIDGVRQDFGRPSHAGNGSFYIDPDMLKAVTVIRGPVAGVYGSGGIGGSISFETIDGRDYLEDDEDVAVGVKGGYESNGKGWLARTIGAVRVSDNAEILVSTVNRGRDEQKDGDGDRILYSDQNQNSQLVKASYRPAPGHEIKAGWLRYGSGYKSSRSAGSSSSTLSVDDTDTDTYTANLRYTFNSPTNPLINLQAELYRSATTSDQSRVTDGDSREYRVRTNGWALKNRSNIAGESWNHTLNYGGDGFEIKGRSDHENFGSGDSKAFGVYGQWEAEYNQWLQVIGALRYDRFKLRGQDTDQVTHSFTKDRVSPRLTLGITPIQGVTTYITYAEGFRAPSLAEAFRVGGHGSRLEYLPNFNLKPESASTVEIGLNLKHNAVFMPNDALRTKLSFYHTRVRDYIDREQFSVGQQSYSQYQNVGKVTLKGIELDSRYDTGRFYAGLNGSLATADTYSGRPLNNAPLKRVVFTVGARALDQDLDYGVRWSSTASTERSSATAPRAAGYSLVDMYATWQINKQVSVNFGIDNVLNKAYTDPQAGYATTNPSSWQGTGRNVKLNVGWRFGG